MPDETKIEKMKVLVRRTAPKIKSFKALDVPSLIGLKSAGTVELIGHIREGLEYHSIEHFIRKTNLRKEEAINIVQISPRTLIRRKEKGRFSRDESDRLVRAARIFSQAQQLFEGDPAATNRWLKTSQPALGGATPIEYAKTEAGAREVEALINRLEYGIFS
jgi:putative toxin-antitoxin system antitoxin component (TIGR02293 family)